MALFNSAQALLAAGHSVFFVRLLELEFTAGTMRLWIDGIGSIVVDSDTWTGTGEIVSIGEVGVSENDVASRMDIQVSGVDADFIALAKASEDVRGVRTTLWGSFLDEDLQPVETKLFLARRYLDVATYSGVGPAMRSMSIPAETLWTHRNHAAYAYFSDRDQQMRFPGDRGLERVARYTGDTRVIWPVP